MSEMTLDEKLNILKLAGYVLCRCNGYAYPKYSIRKIVGECIRFIEEGSKSIIIEAAWRHYNEI